MTLAAVERLESALTARRPKPITRVGAVVLGAPAALVALATLLTLVAAAPAALAAPPAPSALAAPAALTAPTALAAPAARTATAASAGLQGDDGAVRIELDSLTPRLVTADGPAVLTVAGRVVNGGDRSVSELAVRVQRGEPVGSDEELRNALAGTTATDSVRPRFTDVAGSLPPGGAVGFRVGIPLRGGDALGSLDIDRPGVYPLLVNVNGNPDFGGRARLAAVRLLLPVLELPADGALGPVPAAVPASSTPLTIVWPLVDRPRRLPDREGRPVLTDDELATSLAPGGRLHGLLNAATQAVPAGSSLAAAMCFAVDPDLIATVAAMTQGSYELADGRPGAGGPAAALWLQRLRTLVADGCVLALPFADVDQVALSRAGLTDLQGRARADGAQILLDTLDVRPMNELAWPAGEVLDERTLTDLASLGDTAVLLDPRGLTDPDRQAGRAAVGLTTGSPATAGLRAVVIDRRVRDALAGTDGGTGPTAGQGSTSQGSTSPAGSGGPLSSQDGLAALVWRVSAAPTGVLVTPPRRWPATEAEAGELLRAAGRLLTARLAEPRDLARLAAAPGAGTTTISYPLQAAEAEIPRSVTGSVAAVRNQLRDFGDATDRDPRSNVDPASLLDPLRYGLLRGTSSAWRGDEQAAANLVADADARLAALREVVHIEPPAGPYLLAASNAPLLLSLNNPLPVQIDVQITLSEVPGLRTGSIDVVQVPAASRRQVRIPTEVIRAGQFSVEAQLSTPGGTALGPRAASRIQLRSTAYGTVTLVLTGGAAVLLVLMAGFRITRRVRAARKATAS